MLIAKWTQTLIQDLKQDYGSISWSSPRTTLALKNAIATILAAYIAWLLNITNPQWAAISALIVLQASSGATIDKAWDRIVATVGAVIIALLVTDLCINSFISLMTVSFLLLLFSFYYARKTDKPYIWILGPATYCLIIFSEAYGVSGTVITNVAYYRATEIIIGTICAVAVSVLLFPSHAKNDIDNTDQKIIDLLKNLSHSCYQRYTTGLEDPKFNDKINEINLLLDTRKNLSRFAQQEKLFNLAKLNRNHGVEEFTLAISESMAEAYYRYQSAYANLSSLFTDSAAKLWECTATTFAAIKTSLATNDQEGLRAALATWQNARDNLLNHYSELRAKDRFCNYDLKDILQWQYFISTLRIFGQMVNRFYCEGQQSEPAPAFHQRIDYLMSFDRFYWLYALKAAIAVIGFSIAAIWLEVPSPSMIPVVIILMLQIDMLTSKETGFYTAVSFLFGTVLSILLISLNISESWLYFLCIGLIIFLQAYLIYGSAKYTFFGIMSAVAFIVGSMSGTGPITDWRSSIILMISTFITVMAVAILITWLWPTTPKQMYAHAEKQLKRYRFLIRTELINHFDYKIAEDATPKIMLSRIFSEFRQNLKLMKALNLDNTHANNLLAEAHFAWHKYYRNLFNLMLIEQTLHIPDELCERIPVRQFANAILPPTQGTEELNKQLTSIDEWLTELRRQTLEGGSLLPVKPLLRTIHFFMLLKNLIRLQNEIETLESKINQIA